MLIVTCNFSTVFVHHVRECGPASAHWPARSPYLTLNVPGQGYFVETRIVRETSSQTVSLIRIVLADPFLFVSTLFSANKSV